jgi:transcription-repair coupling factor (superfamily II helicase)
LSDHLSTPFERAIQALVSPSEKAGIYGLTGSAPSFLIAAAVKKGAGPLIMVCPDGEQAARLAAETRFFLGEDTSTDGSLTDRVLHYPSSDIVPYSFGGQDAEVWIGRMSVLFRLYEGRPPGLLTVGLDALARRIVPGSDLGQTSFSLALGQSLNRDELLDRLVRAGYTRSPLVEDAGEFSVRGFIIDLYPPFYPYPVRIEQLGDEIESIRYFDPSTQRSRDAVPEVQVGPIHMLIADDARLEAGLKRLQEKCEEQGVEKRVRQRLLEDFGNRLRFPGADYYLSLFYDPMETLFDYLPTGSTLMLPDRDTMARSLEDLDEETLRGWESAAEDGLPVPAPDKVYLSSETLFSRLADFSTVIVSSLEVEETDRAGIRLRCSSNHDIRQDLVKSGAYDAGMARLVKRLEGWRDDGNEVFLVGHTRGQALRLMKLLEPYSIGLDFRGEGFEASNLDPDPVPGIRLYIGELSSGFRMEEARRLVITEEEIFGSRVRAVSRKRARGTLISSLADLAEGEAVVHGDYGIGVFRGLEIKDFDGIPSEVMVIEYAGGDLLYHPVQRLQVIQKFVSGSEEPPRIDRLGGKGWAKTKNRVKESIREMAHELLKIYAKRAVTTRSPYSPADEHYATFEAAFEFEETADQARAIQDVMEAMDSDKPMDHLVCGDVGYGKTEIALRAAFRAVMDGKQVAVLVPTTVLAQQHYETFTRRFNGLPIAVDVLSRFRSASQQKETVRRMEQGKLDVIIGTHRLLQKDIVFRDLGLLVLDEEQRFGVTHKERIKNYKAEVDVLTLSATPIPRTLNLSLTGIRDLSIIETPPPNRQSIRTHVMRMSDEVIREAILRELSRGGQVFYVHNRVQTIFRRAASLKKLVPEAAFGVAHGQMASRELERVMMDFITGNFNVLACTSIIESGLDIPRANTIIIERSDTFGLADLYQLRGRVGRSHVRAHAYLLTPPESLMTPDAIKRLAVLQEYSKLGQGFRIAMRDMEIRGAGNILGTSQSGHVVLVGYEMYLDLLEQAVQEIKGEEPPPQIDPEVGLRLEALIPDHYVPDPSQRMNLYKRLSRAESLDEIGEIEEEMLDLYGKSPVPVNNLLGIMRIRVAMKRIRILKMDYSNQDLVVTFNADTPVIPERLIAWAQSASNSVRLLPGDRLAYRIGNVESEARIGLAGDLMDSLQEISRKDSPPPLITNDRPSVGNDIRHSPQTRQPGP